MISLDLDPGLDLIVVGTGNASLTGGGTGLIAGVVSGHLAGQGAAQAAAWSHGA